MNKFVFYEYGNELYIATGHGGMGLLLAGDVLNNSTYTQAGNAAAEFLIRWLETRGFDNESTDDYMGYWNGEEYEIGYWDTSQPEALNHGGDEFMSTVNNYGCVLLPMIHAWNQSSPTYSSQVEGTNDNWDNYTDFREKGLTDIPYSNLSEWMLEEIARMQLSDPGDINHGAIRTGPLSRDDGARITEHIWYAGMTSFGARQVYDITNNSLAFDIAKKQAGHYWELYTDAAYAPWGYPDWYPEWDLDNKWPVDFTGVSNNERAWAAILELDGEYTQGFRQAVFDGGGFGRFTDRHFLLALYQAMKMKDNPYVQLPNVTVNYNSRYLGWSGAQYGDIGYLGTKLIDMKVDATDKAVMFMVQPEAGKDIDIELITPEDNRISGSQPNYQYFEEPGLKYYKVFNLTNETDDGFPTNGTWKVEITGVSSGTYKYRVGTLTSSTVGIDLNPEWMVSRAGDGMRITATITGNPVRVTGAAVTATVMNPDGEIKTLTFRDDGQGGDTFAGDGTYSAVFADTDIDGTYTVSTEATGTYHGDEFTKIASTSFDVVGAEKTKEAYLTSFLFNSRRTYGPGDVIEFRIFAENMGTATIDDFIVYTIKDPSGKQIYKEKKHVYLEPGEATYPLFRWVVPDDAAVGWYDLRTEFSDWEIDYLPKEKGFEVG